MKLLHCDRFCCRIVRPYQLSAGQVDAVELGFSLNISSPPNTCRMKNLVMCLLYGELNFDLHLVSVVIPFPCGPDAPGLSFVIHLELRPFIEQQTEHTAWSLTGVT